MSRLILPNGRGGGSVPFGQLGAKQQRQVLLATLNKLQADHAQLRAGFKALTDLANWQAAVIACMVRRFSWPRDEDPEAPYDFFEEELLPELLAQREKTGRALAGEDVESMALWVLQGQKWPPREEKTAGGEAHDGQ